VPDDPQVRPPIPLHAVSVAADGSPLIIKRKPGRPKKVEVAPSGDELAYAAEVNDAREQHVHADPLVRALGGECGTPEVLHELKIGIAKEAAALLFDRQQAAARARPIEQLISRRIDALHKVALIELGIRRLRADDFIDPYGKQMQTAFRLFLGTVDDVANETLGPGNDLTKKLAAALVGWEARVTG
jgi:hypothetical protein